MDLKFLVDYFQNWARVVETRHNVNPYIFIFLYLVSAIPFWYSVYKIYKHFKKRQYNKLFKWLGIYLITIIFPFCYIAIYGRNLPWWFWIVFLAVIIFYLRSFLFKLIFFIKESKKAYKV